MEGQCRSVCMSKELRALGDVLFRRSVEVKIELKGLSIVLKEC